jgi:hypothetical protein
VGSAACRRDLLRPEGYICVSVESPFLQRERRPFASEAGAVGSLVVGSVEASEEEACSVEYTGPNSQMQLVPRDLGHHLEKASEPVLSDDEGESEEVRPMLEVPPAPATVVETCQDESGELARVKSFCASILKTLAPPLLSEFERTTGLRVDAESFTPKRVTRRSMAAKVGTQGKLASAAESTLLKALGFCPENLAVSDEDLRRFKEFFDSPVREAHLRVLAAIFGKELPTSFEREVPCLRAQPVQ